MWNNLNSELIIYILLFLFGLITGSFLNVCIYRLPRRLSIILPASHCPECGEPVRALYNIPVAGYIFLRGRCRDCGSRISVRYPLVESLNGLLYLLVFWRYGLSLSTLFFICYTSALIVITFIDLEFQIIPDSITLPGTLIAFLGGAFLVADPFSRGSMLGFAQSAAGLLAGYGLFFSIAVLSEMIIGREAMGGGDIKMMAMVGAITGWKGVLFTTFIGSLTGSVIGVGLMVMKGQGRRAKIPFGPFLSFASLVSLLCGQELAALYMALYDTPLITASSAPLQLLP